MRYVIGLIVLVLFFVVFTRGAILYPQAWGGLLLEFLPLVVLVIGIGTVVGVVQKRAEQRRDREYELFCSEHGFCYLASPAGDQTGFDAFWLLKQGWSGAQVRGVARTGFEPVISGLKGRRPGPLDERAIAGVGGRRGFRTPDLQHVKLALFQLS